MTALKIMTAACAVLAASALHARCCGNRIIRNRVQVPAQSVGNTRSNAASCVPGTTFNASGVVPADYSSKKDFIAAYVDQEMAALSQEQRDEDRRRLGGEGARKTQFRREAERRWNAYVAASSSSAEAPAASQGEPVLQKHLEGLPLPGLFGIKFGDTPGLEGCERIGNSSTYVFTPPKKFRRFGRYVFSVTPITHKVYGIRAFNMSLAPDENGTAFDMNREWEIVKGIFEKKFQKEAKIDIGTMVCPNFRLIFPGADGKMEREIQVVFPSSITAVDIKLKALAEEERNVLARKQMDESVNEGLDAL